ncbi:adenylate/guanylate cyclase domain-containing protein [Pseudobdellovibrio exovorus]|uniref:Guanylate cyclase domain-containing protein n=1 Tax=Pseudobdellovibrio exovorus JSS TaxID=1184267 RepID=M4VDZ8_9BACT|nr:adenylate/guanylate cyclase domain-containing protein [Pseudobdellovibrio exovorus]AGH96266.1 hypothetical protein A11Q_2050 [Pseudobdellovibrio exovorus JSS]
MDRSEFDKKIQAEEVHDFQVMHKLFLVFALVYPLFGILDFIFYPEHLKEFLILRFVYIPIPVGCYLLSRKIQNNKALEFLSFFHATIAAAIITYMSIATKDGINSAYYAGLNLVGISALLMFSFSWKMFFVTSASVYLPYLLYSSYKAGQQNDFRYFFAHAFFITSTFVIAICMNSLKQLLKKKVLSSRLALEEELFSREQIIKQKTEEATKLHQLSAQFSPQVVKAIREGQISIDESVQRVKICAIFIDIVRSTDKVTKLPEQNIQLCLARFLDTCLTIFLKYDLTIDKFHGDGLLAFSNMPISREDFIERTCMAALEAVDGIKADREFYMKHWMSELQVRVGISVGYANVGFYGNRKYFKTFTAIGTPLPYASRLTSIAEPNQILVNQEIAENLNQLGYVLKSQGQKQLKGFEEDKNPVFELISAPHMLTHREEAKTCPDHPHSVLFLDTNNDGHFVFKCRECDYEESQVGFSDRKISKAS